MNRTVRAKAQRQESMCGPYGCVCTGVSCACTYGHLRGNGWARSGEEATEADWGMNQMAGKARLKKYMKLLQPQRLFKGF